MRYWFTADLHFGHGNIITYCNRPFKDADEMNSKLIHNINERVKPEDVVFHVGDFCMRRGHGYQDSKATDWEEQLNGKWIFIKGNHDANNSCKTCILNVKIQLGGVHINLVHKPEHYDPNVPLNIVGHVHNHWKSCRADDSILVNCGVDVWKYRPVSIDEILKEYNERRN